MKLVMDERLKHRVVGLLVVVSIAAIFVPAIVKKSNHRFEGKGVTMMSLQLPDKPPMPKVVVPEQQIVFNRTKVAHVDLALEKPSLQTVTTIRKAERLGAQSTTALDAKKVVAEPIKVSEIQSFKGFSKPQRESKIVAIHVKKPEQHNPSLLIAKNVAAKPLVNKAKITNKNVISKKSVPLATAKADYYAIQLGIFSEKNNALTLLNKLKKVGFDARSIATSTGKRPTYKVLVGNVQGKEGALQLQKRLARLTALNGFIVPSKVG